MTLARASGWPVSLLLAVPLLVVRTALRRHPSRVLGWALAPARATSPAVRPFVQPPLAARLVEAAARRLPFDFTCLEKACVALFLSGRGARLVLGVAHPSASFRAHAWLEFDGEILMGAPGRVGMNPLPARRASLEDTGRRACGA
jgi:hypothetical protein